jgi:hypothetical protein
MRVFLQAGNFLTPSLKRHENAGSPSFIGCFGTYFIRRHPDLSAVRAVWPL